MPRSIPTFCRICESQCGLVAEVDGEQLVALRPDPEHPVSRGYACRKGTHFGEVHDHPDRVLHPLVRRDGVLVRTTWEDALRGAGARLRSLVRAHGRDAVGLYLGNASVGSLGAILGAQVLQHALGTRKVYSALTLDNAPMFVVTEACLGNAMRTFVADYAGSDLVVLVGTDPLSSQPSQAQSHPRGPAELREVARRDGLVVVDPRASTTARAASLHLRVRPGTDVALLAFLLREILAARPRPDAAEQGTLSAAVAPFDASFTERITGVDPRPLASRLLAAERPLVWSGLGVLLGPDGTVGYWLTLALQAALGGLDRAGGWLPTPGAIDLPGLLGAVGPRGSDPANRSRIGGHPAVLGNLAAATLADDALTPDAATPGRAQLRALVVIAGNPALSLPDSTKAAAALARLDIVSVNLFANETAAYASTLLPAADWLEREDVALQLSSQRRLPHLQRSPAVVPPRGEARTDWEILTGLAAAVGGVVPRLARLVDPTTIAAAAVTARAPFSWRALTASGRGLVADPAPHRPLRIRLAVPAFVEALGEVYTRLARDRGGFRLVTSVRPVGRMNTWIGSVEGVATLHPADHAALGAPPEVRVVGPAGSLVVPARADPGVSPGSVVLPWGSPGGNANAVIGAERRERFTGQPCSNGEDVRVEPA